MGHILHGLQLAVDPIPDFVQIVQIAGDHLILQLADELMVHHPSHNHNGNKQNNQVREQILEENPVIIRTQCRSPLF
ncbi:hypothetical protein D3C87_2104000 [compost metagenome]